jgi:hypothetical protein
MTLDDEPVDTSDKDEGSHRIPGDPSRDGRQKDAPGPHGGAEKREKKEGEPARQPGGGRHSESEKPSSPDSRWGGGRNA